MSKETAIEVNGLFKHFRLPTERSSSIKQAFVNFTRGVKGYREQNVLCDVSFIVNKGDFFGVVGRNGSGKSTLLKLISGIYESDGGSIKVNGSLVSFIELGVGFNGDLTGRENVYLNGALLGFSKKEVDTMYDEIVEFAELGDFMDQKLKNYSSGMQVRLAFSCAIRAKSDILVLDEVLAVGDEAFQRKCDEFFLALKKDSQKTVILVTHNMSAVRNYCDKAILVKDGIVVAEGEPREIADKYSVDNLLAQNKVVTSQEDVDAPILTARLVSSSVLTNNDELIVEAEYKAVNTRPVLIKFCPLSYDNSLMTANSKVLHNITTANTEKHIVRYTLPLKCFNNGDFSLVVMLTDADTGANIAAYGYGHEIVFKVSDRESQVGGAFINQGDIELIR